MEDQIHSFILLGKTGEGKSGLAKFLSETKDKNKFIIYDKKGSGTSKVEDEMFTYENTRYRVIDTPGFFDSKEERIENNKNSILNAIKDSKNPISTILMVVNFQNSRIDESSQICVAQISELFPMVTFWEHVVIIFTKFFSSDPEELEELKINWENDIELFKSKIKSKNINNNLKIKTFYINNSKKNINEKMNSKIRGDILNYIKNTKLFYSSQYTIKIPKERLNLSYKNNEPDEKFGNVEKRIYRSYEQVVFVHPNKKLSMGPIIKEKRWTEQIEFFEKLEKLKKIKMKHLYIDGEHKGDFVDSYELLDINKIDHWEISCECGFKDTTKFAHSSEISNKTAIATDIVGGFVGSLVLTLLGPAGWAGLAIGAVGGLASGIGGYFGGKKVGEKISQSAKIGLDTFEKGCPKCGKLELEIIPKFKN